MKADIIDKIKALIPGMSRNQKIIAHYIIEHTEEAAFNTAAMIGKKLDISESTVVRFAAAVGYSGFPKLQQALVAVVKNRLHKIEKLDISNNTSQSEILQFVMKKSTGKVVMFTSTTSGEGKTFVASNLAMSVALLGKKVLLMGLDIRRPRLAEMFGFNKHDEGITSYLAADEKDTDILDRAIRPSGIEENLDILLAGIVPPNPAELLARPNMDKAIEYLSTKYDYIILDTAPVALVTDSMIISRVADVVAYVARLAYTQKADIKYLNSIVAEGKLENVSLVVISEDVKKKMYGYVSTRRGSNRYVGYGYISNEEQAKKK